MSGVTVIGAGQWGKNLVRNFYELGALAAIAELDPAIRERLVLEYSDIPILSSFEAALAAPAPAVVLATPAPTHFDLAWAALQAGKDVFVEKPMTLQTSEARQLAELADGRSQVLMVGHLLLYQPAISWMGDYLASGAAGEVLHVETRRAKLGRVRRQENVWWSFAPHDVSVVLALLGNPRLVDVVASGRGALQLGVEDWTHVSLVFDGGQTAHLHCSWHWPKPERCTIIVASKQMLVYDELAATVTVYDCMIDERLQNCDGGSWQPELCQEAPLRLECQHFLDCLASRQTPQSGGWHGVAVVEVLERAMEALRG